MVGVLAFSCLVAPAIAAIHRWEYFTIESPLPGEEWGCGDPVLADFDDDGDLDIVSKVWNADGNAYHADYWRNDN